LKFSFRHVQQCFSTFFEAEPFAGILIAHETHGLSQKFVQGEIVKFEAKGRDCENKFLERVQQARESEVVL